MRNKALHREQAQQPRPRQIGQATAANQKESLRIFRLRFAGGVVSQVEVSQVESQYQQAMQAIPLIEQQIAAQENLLSVLLGRPPGPILRGRGIDPAWPKWFAALEDIPIAERPEDILVTVAGGPGGQSLVAVPWGLSRASTTVIAEG